MFAASDRIIVRSKSCFKQILNCTSGNANETLILDEV